MKKQYIFLLLIIIILYLTYQIIDYKYREYKIKSHISYIENLNSDILNKINIANSIIEYKTSKAYKNKVLKEELGYKSYGEKVIYLTSEDNYNKYTKKTNQEIIDEVKKENVTIDVKSKMNIFERWIFLIFKKDISL